jgi:tetratricopeptide (TPR) repeat protein
MLMHDRVEFKKATEIEIAKMSPPDANRLLRVIREIVNGLSMSGIEQGECMRAARQESQDLVEDASGDKNPIGWLIQGWLCLWNSSTSSEACNFFARGIALLTDKTSFLAYLLYRYRAVGYDVAGRATEALEDAKTALALRPRPELQFEASRYAIQVGHKIEAKRYLEAAIQAEPLTVFVAMADSEMTSVEPLIFAGCGQAEILVRTAALKSIEDWKTLVQKSRDSERTLGVSLELPDEICTGFEEMLTHAKSGDLLEIWGVQSQAIRNSVDLFQIAIRRVGSIADKRRGDAESAQQIVDSVVKKRDSVTHRAQHQAETIITQMESELHRSLNQDDRSTQGCATGLGGSFAMFMAFVVTAGFLNQRGVETGWDSPVGMAGICLICAPIVIALGANAASGIKRTAVGSEVERRAAHAREMAKVTLVEVEKNCAKQAVELRSEAAELDSQSKKAAEAQRILLEAPRPINLSSQSVSKRAA